MKKILLSLLAVFVATTSFAYEVGDYIYTQTAKYKVIGDNLVPALSSWNGADNVDVWSVYTADDATENCLQSLDGGESATPLYASVNLTFGSSYVITLKVKAPTDASTSITDAAQNQIDAWLTVDPTAGTKTGTAGTDYIQVASTASMVGGEYTELSFAVTNATLLTEVEPNVLTIKIGRLTTETVIADVEIREVASVYDTRIADRKLDFAKALLADTNLNEANSAIEDFQGLVDFIEEIKDTEAGESEVEMSDALAALADAQTEYLNAVSSDLASSFDRIDITSVTKINNGNGGGSVNQGCWSTSGQDARWGHPSGSEWIDYSLPGSYVLGWGQINLTPNTELPAGKYLFMCDLFATEYYKTKVNGSYYGENLSVYAEGTKIFVNSDTITVGPLANQSANAETYYIIGEVKEGETFSAGAWFPGFDPYGGTFRIGHASVRSIGDVASIIERNGIFEKFLTQYNAALNARNNVVAAIDNAEFPWEQDSLKNALATWDPYLEAVASWVNDGKDTKVASNEELENWTTYQGDETQETTYQVVRGYQYAYNYAVAQNKPYVDLVAKIQEADEAMASGKYSSDHGDVDATLEAAKAAVAAVSATNEYDAFTELLSGLTQALNEWYEGSASYATPAEVTIVDPNFTDKTGNIAGGKTTYWNDATGATGWVSYTTEEKEYFRVGNGGTDAETGEYVYEGVNRANMWRGWTGNPKGSLTQEVTVSKAGHYEFKCQAFATGDGDNGKILSGVRKVTTTVIGYEVNEEGEEIEITQNDTTYVSGVKLLFGSSTELKIDSVEIWTAGETYNNYTPQWFSLSYDKATDGDEVLKFGIDGLSIGDYVTAGIYSYGPNAYGIGSCHLLYGGPSDKYYADEAVGIENIVVAEPVNKKVKGVYSITGQKVAESLTNLPKGIYIYNGKKYLVK